MYKIMVRLLKESGKPGGRWTEVRPFGGIIRFAFVSDANAFMKDYENRNHLPERDLLVVPCDEYDVFNGIDHE